MMALKTFWVKQYRKADLTLKKKYMVIRNSLKIENMNNKLTHTFKD